MMITARRSALYVPAGNARVLEKAQTLAADVLLFDLEDAIAPEAKIAARETISHAIQTHDYGSRERILRVNALTTPWGREDLALAVSGGFDGVLLPKVESAVTVDDALTVMGCAMPIWVMVETPQGVLAAHTIASHPQVQTLVMGVNDLAHAMGITDANDAAMAYAYGHCIMVAKATQCSILSGVMNALDDSKTLRQLCVNEQRMGFDGKTVIHPKQLEITNQVFSPSQQAISEARGILAAWQAADGKGVVVYNGRIVEHLHVKSAQRVLALAQKVSSF